MNNDASAYSWSRRQVMRTLVGTAGIPVLGSGGVPKRRVCIVGGGMAGISLAWLLDGELDVTLLEARGSLGGNVQSVNVELDGHTFVVDMGAQYFHPALYPIYVKLLSVLGLLNQVRSFPASITAFASSEPKPRFVSPVLPGRAWPLLAPWNRAGLQAFAVGFAAAKQREEENASWSVTLEAWLPTLNLSREQWEGMLLPWAASLFSGSVEQARGLSARAAMIFAAKALPDNPLQPLLYYVLSQGLAEALSRMVEEYATVRVLTRALVGHVSRNLQGGFTLRVADGRIVHVDELVFASSGPSTRQLLGGIPGTEGQQAALQGIEFEDARLALHTDPVYAPSDANNRSFFNCEVQGAYCEASMWLAEVLTEPPAETAAKLWKSWVTHRQRQPMRILHEARFRHMVPTTASLRAQSALLALQGQGNIWFAGGYTRPYDSQETALVSALDVAQGLQAVSARGRALVK